MASRSFPFRFHPAFRIVAAPLGINPNSCELAVRDQMLQVRFGPWKVSTPLTNVDGASVSGPYAWPKVIGPPHLSFADKGLTFATNPHRGVCVQFRRPVNGIDPVGAIAHPAMTVTVEDVSGLVELLDGVVASRTAAGGLSADGDPG